MATPALDLWMNGEHVGTWLHGRTGTAVLRYADSWVKSPQARPLSLSLPIPAGEKELRGPVVDHYFDNLLPDSGRIRERLRRRFGAASTTAPDLLAAIGRDCVGAVQLQPQGQPPAPHARIDSEALSDDEVARALRHVTSDPVLGQGGEDADDLPISIAGAQEKTALLRIDGRWHRPHAATPTTHILKLPLGLVGNMRADMSTSVENEWLCARIMAALGFPVAATEIGRFGDQKALVVERFDRRWMAGGRWIARLPQEDFCQATGTPAHMKYESDGGPGLRACLALLAASDDSRADRLCFVLVQLAFWLLAATDGHAKNYSIALHRGGRYAMTPLYDMLSVWPIVGRGPSQVPLQQVRLAMAVRSKNAHFRLLELQPRHWQLLATQSGVEGTFERMLALVQSVPEALRRVESQLPVDFPESVWLAISQGMLSQCERFDAGLSILGTNDKN
ncbi:Serine/threonine-protein kinase HipA [Xylophilus ampelinus]|nr:type II toxin-antitoxin system HipA family toxin [Variovorax sp.]VTY33516.1 Serine/threonine-protein kinase HipA [Xylophilus ampelinus]